MRKLRGSTPYATKPAWRYNSRAAVLPTVTDKVSKVRPPARASWIRRSNRSAARPVPTPDRSNIDADDMAFVALLSFWRHDDPCDCDQRAFHEPTQGDTRRDADHSRHVIAPLFLKRRTKRLRVLAQCLKPKRPVQRQVALPQRTDQPWGFTGQPSASAMRCARRWATASFARRGQVSIPAAETMAHGIFVATHDAGFWRNIVGHDPVGVLAPQLGLSICHQIICLGGETNHQPRAMRPGSGDCRQDVGIWHQGQAGRCGIRPAS